MAAIPHSSSFEGLVSIKTRALPPDQAPNIECRFILTDLFAPRGGKMGAVDAKVLGAEILGTTVAEPRDDVCASVLLPRTRAATD